MEAEAPPRGSVYLDSEDKGPRVGALYDRHRGRSLERLCYRLLQMRALMRQQ